MEKDIAAIYCRLSKEDGDKENENEASESINNQKMLLINYALDQGYGIYDIYSDDDYSGMYNDRPSFERLLRDAGEHKFNIVLAKTQSRFTRNMEHVEKYLHNDFQRLGIRFIGVVDGADTDVKSNKKARQINGLVNEWYCEDLSDNIRAVFREKMKNGQFLGSFACYGYACDPQDRHKLIIDEEAADTVRMIFELSGRGDGMSVIARKLTEMNIPTPTEYKRQKGLKYQNPNESRYKKKGWSATTIKRILNNEMYIGTLIQGREKKISYKSKKIILAPKSEWVVIKNNHAPIITEKLFNATQELIKRRRKSCLTASEKSNTPHLFAGMLKCLDCGSTMVKTSGRQAGSHDYLICQLSRRSGQKLCSRHSIRYADLKSCVEQRIREMIKQFGSNEYLTDRIRQSISEKIEAQKLRLARCIKKTEEICRTISMAYVDKANGKLMEGEFLIIKSQLEKEIENQEKKQKILIQELNQMELKAKDIMEGNWLKRLSDFPELTYSMLNDIIECIYIGEKAGDKQEIVINWRI